jgi:hypothetical protein
MDDDRTTSMGLFNTAEALPLLKKQHEYFEYASDWLYFLRDQLVLKKKKSLEATPHAEPKSLPQPPRDSGPAVTKVV